VLDQQIVSAAGADDRHAKEAILSSFRDPDPGAAAEFGIGLKKSV
jgi:hypothetical protein